MHANSIPSILGSMPKLASSSKETTFLITWL